MIYWSQSKKILVSVMLVVVLDSGNWKQYCWRGTKTFCLGGIKVTDSCESELVWREGQEGEIKQ